VIVEDTTPPEWAGVYTTITINTGDILQLVVQAEDFSGIDHYSVNDTRFVVSSEGVLTSVIQLNPGTYPILVSVYDIYDNMNTMEIVIIVQGGGLPSEMFLVIMVGVFTAIAVAGFIAILVIRKRRTGG
jgi:hypothetical protein